MDRVCKYCNKVFTDIVGRVFSNHVRWCNKNASSYRTENIAAAVKRIYDNKLGAVREFEVKCAKCSKLFCVSEREKTFPNKKQYFCSRSCANSKAHSSKTKTTISKSLLERNKVSKESRVCLECNKIFIVSNKSQKKYCCRRCVVDNRRSDSDYLNYHHDCKFKFNVWKYPQEFDLGLIKKYGWYKAVNRGNNLNGVSRDHKISISYGWQNNISPEIMSHPANCQLMRHGDNSRKNNKCSIMLEQLLRDIEVWKNNYGNGLHTI